MNPISITVSGDKARVTERLSALYDKQDRNAHGAGLIKAMQDYVGVIPDDAQIALTLYASVDYRVPEPAAAREVGI